MTKKSTLRWLIALEIALLLISSLVLDMEPSANLQPFGVYVTAPQDSQGNDIAMTRLEWAVGIILILIGTAAYVGLLRFKPWGRRWYVIYHALTLSLLPLGKPVLATGWDSLLTGISAMVTGAILALLFLIPLKEHFGKTGTAAKESVVPAIARAINNETPADRVNAHAQEKETASPGPEGTKAPEPNAPGAAGNRNLIDRFTNRLFPKSAEARAAEEPTELKSKRRALLLEHYIFILASIFSILLTENSVSGLGLIVVALGVILANLAQRKGGSFAVLCSALVAVYCGIKIFLALFGFMLLDFSKNALPYFLPFSAALLLLLMLEIGTFKFVRKHDQPPQESAKSKALTTPEP